MAGSIRMILAMALWLLSTPGWSAGPPVHAGEAVAPLPIAADDLGLRNGGRGAGAPAMVAQFDPGINVIPFPNNLLLRGSLDLTVNIPVSNPSNFNDPAVALNAVDGFSAVAPWSTQFSASIEPGSIHAGTNVRVFEVQLTALGASATVQQVVRELTAPGEFTVAVDSNDATGRTLAIIPTRPLKELTSYMAVITRTIASTAGTLASPSVFYSFTQRPTPLASGTGPNCVSLDPQLPNATACALEPFRVLTNSFESAAAAAGVTRSDIVLTWVLTTQGATSTLAAVRSTATPAATSFIFSGLTTAVAGSPPIGDVYFGVIDLPYYHVAPGTGSPPAPPTVALTSFWTAAPGAYVPPYNTLGLDPTSTHLTVANPHPLVRSVVKVPVLATLPNVQSGQVRPPGGWPVAIFQHGLTRNRTDMLALAATLAAQGLAVVAIDQPLHGVASGNPFYIGATPFAAQGARERTFDIDLVNNATGSGGPDGLADDSGAHFINLSSLLTWRDNLRQADADLLRLALSIPAMNVDGSAGADLDGQRVAFVSHSISAGPAFMALEPTVTTAVLSVSGGGNAYLLNGSATFGPRIRAGLTAAGLTTPLAQAQFLRMAQSVTDSGDPINYALLAAGKRILLHEVVGGVPDQVVPNLVVSAPLAGTEPLVAALGLSPITQTTIAASGIRGVVRFNQGDHGSLLSPFGSLATMTEMQAQMMSLLASNGTQVTVGNPSVIRSPLADLTITLLEAPDPVTAGSTFRYSVTVRNLGSTEAQGVQVTLPLPAATSFVSAAASAGGTCNSASPVVCSWAGVTAPGAFRSASIVVAVPSGHTAGLSATASVASATADPVPGNNTMTASTAVQVRANLAISTAGSTVAINNNDPATLVGTSTNIGPSIAQDVNITIALGTAFGYASHSASAGASCTTPAVGASGSISCTWAGATASGAQRSVTVGASSNSAGSTTNQVSTASATTDPVPGNNAAQLAIQKLHAVDGTVLSVCATGLPPAIAIHWSAFTGAAYCQANESLGVTTWRTSTCIGSGCPDANDPYKLRPLRLADEPLFVVANPGTSPVITATTLQLSCTSADGLQSALASLDLTLAHNPSCQSSASYTPSTTTTPPEPMPDGSFELESTVDNPEGLPLTATVLQQGQFGDAEVELVGDTVVVRYLPRANNGIRATVINETIQVVVVGAGVGVPVTYSFQVNLALFSDGFEGS